MRSRPGQIGIAGGRVRSYVLPVTKRLLSRKPQRLSLLGFSKPSSSSNVPGVARSRILGAHRVALSEFEKAKNRVWYRVLTGDLHRRCNEPCAPAAFTDHQIGVYDCNSRRRALDHEWGNGELLRLKYSYSLKPPAQ